MFKVGDWVKLVDVRGWPHNHRTHTKPIPGAIYQALEVDNREMADSIVISTGFPGICLHRVELVPDLIED